VSLDLIAKDVAEHLERLVPARPDTLLQMEQRAAQSGFPVIGPTAGHFCYLVARLIGARSIFEMGSGYGYSTAFFARAVRENGGGRVHHTVWDEALSRDARRYLDALGLGSFVQFTVGEAVETLRAAAGPFDLIFNDIDKAAYPASLDVIEQKLRPGGVLLVDNMLWSGRIFDAQDQSAATEGVRELTRRITHRPGWIVSVVPIRDGLLLALRS
jgi:predicted O-methyltransferase YrrM